jgi:CheY-like chemotaxis protein
MPKKDGREALREIKEHPGLKHLEVIIFSTSNSDRDKEFTLGLGATKYIVKPSDHEELKSIFMEICNELVAKPGWRYAINPAFPKKKQG